MAVPARKVSKTSGRMRRTHYKINAKTTTTCPKCGSAVKPHRVCPKCGSYKGEEIIKKESKEENE
ncbi:MAG TPA: 50S ribosomal protein L32 [Candidatus Coprosoma intestinipullorum]|uniref:Large ribosomal subunit protein bL32 n=1 Tax=Candidatus Coprosoma intestinipullorum TaxID=2840752 RepID=A0A9D0ZQX8_9FIRM|nr:50S ribosomal protein L32 [Candidatus Coprosoma intestinipullorum]